jgi:hypothetical protein
LLAIGRDYTLIAPGRPVRRRTSIWQVAADGRNHWEGCGPPGRRRHFDPKCRVSAPMIASIAEATDLVRDRMRRTRQDLGVLPHQTQAIIRYA